MDLGFLFLSEGRKERPFLRLGNDTEIASLLRFPPLVAFNLSQLDRERDCKTYSWRRLGFLFIYLFIYLPFFFSSPPPQHLVLETCLVQHFTGLVKYLVRKSFIIKLGCLGLSFLSVGQGLVRYVKLSMLHVICQALSGTKSSGMCKAGRLGFHGDSAS